MATCKHCGTELYDGEYCEAATGNTHYPDVCLRYAVAALRARVAELENVASEVRDLKGDLSKANARVQDLEEFIRPFAEGAHDIDCDCDHLACTCIVGPAQELLGKGRDRAADRMGTDS